VGVRVEGLVPRVTVHRQGLLGERERGWSDADRAVDRASRRFGSAAVRPASLLNRDERHHSGPSERRPGTASTGARHPVGHASE
jgi:hypothetical protein